MAEEELVASSVASPTPLDHHKRKLEDLEAPPPDSTNHSLSKSISDPDSPNNEAEEEENGGAEVSEAKRPRLETNINQPDGLVSQNGHQEEEKGGEVKEDEDEQPVAPVEGSQSPLEAQEPIKEALEAVSEEPESTDEKPETESAEEPEQLKPEVEESSKDIPGEGNVPPADLQPVSATQIMSRHLEVPNDKVGVLIGKAGDTIRSLQDNSGAKIQITKDADADPRSTTRPLELIGTLESIVKAEKLIKDVIAEADAGGSPSLVARGFSTVQAAGGGEQLEIQVPFEKVGLIIGKGGETIRNLQTRSGARIQLIQQNTSEGDQSRERTVRVSGSKRQIEIATEMIKDVMNQTIRPSPLSSGYGQQSSRPRGPDASQWGPRGPHHAQFSSYDYPQRGPYPSQNSQYLPPYGNYPPQQGPRSNFGSSWEQRPPASIRGVSHQGNYNYGQQQGPDYGHPPPYSQTPAQPFGHGYNEVKYDHHPSSQHFGQVSSQPTPYAQGGAHSGYGPQDQYGKPPTYGMPPQVPHSQSYGQPRPNQPGPIPHQGNITSAQSYGQNVPPQQSYPYASSGHMQQNYPPYGSVVSTDGYNHPPPTTTSASGYPPQGGQPVAGYVQPGTQQPLAYPQAGPTGGYGSYPTAQPGYAEQTAVNNTVYGYQGPADAAYGGAQGQAAAYGGAQGQAAAYGSAQGQAAAYGQPSQTQPTYDQSGGYGSAPVPAGYGKSASPQAAYPQYDSSQTYAAHR